MTINNLQIRSIEINFTNVMLSIISQQSTYCMIKLREVQNQAKLIYCALSHAGSGLVVTGREHSGFVAAGNVLKIDLDSGYMCVFILWKFINFVSVCETYMYICMTYFN